MRRFLILSFFLSLFTTSYSQGIEFVHVRWQEALEMAKEQNQLLFVDSYAEWCGPCKRMAKTEFVKTEVGAVYNSNFVNLKLDMESKNGRTFGSKYPVSAYPTMFFLDGDGKVVKKVKGGKKGEQLIAMAELVLKSYDTSGKFQEKYDEGDRSYAIVSSYVDALNKASKPSLKISNDYLMSEPDITEEQRLKFYHIATVDADSKIFDLMVENKKDLIALIGVEAFDKKIKSACNNTISKAIEYEAISLLDEAITKSKNLTIGTEEFSLEAKMQYASSMRETKMFADAAEDLAKLYIKSDPKKIDGIIAKIHKIYGENTEMLNLSKSIGKMYNKKAKSVNSSMSYAKALILLEDYKEADKVLNKGIERGNKAGEQVNALEMLLKLVESRKKAQS